MTPPAKSRSAISLPIDQITSSPARQEAIAPLSSLPQRSPTSTRTLSSPPISPNSNSGDAAVFHEADYTKTRDMVLTPPATPTRLRKHASSGQILGDGLGTNDEKEAFCEKGLAADPICPDGTGEDGQPRYSTEPREFTLPFNPVVGPGIRAQEYGRGIWSVVYRVTLSKPGTLLSPANSPDAPSRTPQVLAVKSPLSRTSIPVLLAEAKLLTYLSSLPNSVTHIIPFHGFHTPTSSIVLSPVPLSLATYISSASSRARTSFSTRTMFDPILGTSGWLTLAHQVISTLSWLHNAASVIHADLKPGNILLRPLSTDTNISSPSSESFPYQALYADFSSSFHSKSTPSTSSLALTTSFAAPELVSKNSTASPTQASDVYSLAITLLAAATGDIAIYPTQYEIQRLAMAREGTPLEFVRLGAQGTRIRRGGVVDKSLKEAVRKEPSSRITAQAWLEMLEASTEEGNGKRD